MGSTFQIATGASVGGRRDRLARASLRAATVLPVLAAVLWLGSVAPASAGIGIDVRIAPPPPRAVVVPPPRAGFEWAPGYWRWNGHRHVWVEGHWLRARRGFHWVPEHWVERRGHYRFVPGHWARG